MYQSIQRFCLAILFSLISMTAHAQTIDDLFHHQGDPVAGNPQGSITIVEFFDYQCSHCIHMASAINNIINNNKNVRVVFKDYPIRGPLSDLAARAALASIPQGKYYEFSHAMLVANEELSMTNIMQIAATVGLDMTRLKRDMHNAEIDKELDYTSKLAETLKITGTPAIFVGKTDTGNLGDVTFIPGEVSQNDLQKIIDGLK